MGTPDESPHPVASDRIGPASLAFFGLAAAVPVVALVTLVPAAFAQGFGPLTPLALVGSAVVLLPFCVGYAAMSRRIPHAGAIYAFVARGLGRPAGLSASWLALISYQAIQFGLYALVGAAVAPLLRSWFDVSAPAWAPAAACWALVALCGPVRIEVTAGLITALAVVAAAVPIGLGSAGVVAPAGGRVTAESIQAPVDRPALGLLLAAGVLVFAGFETTAAYAEEGPHAARGGYGAVALIALLLGGVSWAMIVAAGPDRVAGTAAAHGGETLFVLAAERLAPWAVTLGRIALLVGLFVGALALHHAIARYLYALGRERALPGVLSQTGGRTAAPRAASVTQSLIAGAGLAGAYAAGAVPDPERARWLAVGGGLGVLVLLLVTAVATLLHLNRAPGDEGVATRFVAPLLAAVALGALCLLALRDLPALFAVPSDYVLVRAVPAVLAGCVLLGCGQAALLRARHPLWYAGIGLGGTAVVVTPTIPRPRAPEEPKAPGAHRPERVSRKSPAPR